MPIKLKVKFIVWGDTGEISVAFINTKNQTKEGIEYSTTYPSVENGAMTDYVVHPAFVDYEGKELSGIWIGKYESSNSNNKVKIVEGVESWILTASDSYDESVKMKEESNPYGITQTIDDPHLIKNTDWGAVAYLAHSNYGKQAKIEAPEEYDRVITGYAGVKGSTTGNETGIYDMSGGRDELVAAYIEGSSGDDLKSLLTAQARHKDIYQAGETDSREANYEAAKNKYGDAIWETSLAGIPQEPPLGPGSAWYYEWSQFPLKRKCF